MEKFNIYPNVKIGKNAQIGNYCIIGLPPKGKRAGELKTVIGDNVIVRSHTVIYAGNKIGDFFQTGHFVMIREMNKIGNHVSIGTHSIIEHHVKIADKVRIHSAVFVPELSILREGCWIGPNVTLTNAIHPLCPQVKKCLKGPIIGRKAKIGANATILPYVKIGENVLIGAGSVVVDNIGRCKLAVGNPARVIKDIDELKCKFKRGKRPY